MSASEQALLSQRLRERIESILSPEELADYDAYQQRLQAAIARHGVEPVEPTNSEQRTLDKLSADMQAAALQKQLMVLLRIETLPQ